ncbi:MAG: type I-E CRISPR-associated protein Cse1/CasA [Nitrospira sp.]|nr:type I-E CRISPR-associated protein Cse1/CasA [Nitrospira sp.]
MKAFDLTHEPWIPVLIADTNLRDQPEATVTFCELGLRDVLKRAHHIREVYCDSPIETVAIYRLLLAIGIDGFWPSTGKSPWLERWRQGNFDPAEVDAYFDRPEHREAFFLIHPERPFYQHPQPLAKEPAPLSKLFHGEASGNNGTLFDHSVDDLPQTAAPALVARGLLATQAAAIGGGVAIPFNFSHGPLVGGAIFWIRGNCLFEGLLLNAPPYDKARAYSGEDTVPDVPCWRAELPDLHERRAARSYLDYLTWQARRITVQFDLTNPFTLKATGVYFSQGDRNDPIKDPLMATVIPRDAKKEAFPFNFRPDRALWRDASGLLQLTGEKRGNSPRTFQWLQEHAQLRYAGVADWRSLSEQVDVFGLMNDQAKIELWRHDRMPVYFSYLIEQERVLVLEALLEFAEEQALNLRDAAKRVANYALASPRAGGIDLPKADTGAATNFVNALGAEPRYWGSLETHFYQALAEIAALPLEEANAYRWEWAMRIFHNAQTAFRDATAALDQSARLLRAVAEGERVLRPVKEFMNRQKALKEVIA